MDLGVLKCYFKKIDKDNDGYLTFEELQDCLKLVGCQNAKEKTQVR